MPCQLVIKVALFAVRCAVQAALAVMVAGAALAGLTDLTFSLPGYTWVLICAISTAVYLLLIKSLNRDTGRRLQRSSGLVTLMQAHTVLMLYNISVIAGLNQHALLLYNTMIALPLMLVFSGAGV